MDGSMPGAMAGGSRPRLDEGREYRLLQWLNSPGSQRGIHFAGADDSWEFYSYDRLAVMARQQAWRLHAQGVGPGHVVALVHGNSPEFVAAFFGCLMLGGTPAPVAPPARFQTADYQDHLTRIFRLGGVSVVSTTTRLASVVTQAARDSGVVTAVADEPGLAPEWPEEPVASTLGLLQFSSGTTGPSRGVLVPLTALEANLDMIESWTGGRAEDDAVATWVPLHHDMGLIGCLLCPVSRGVNVWLMEPEQFVRAPRRWLRCFGEYGATITAAPTFGLGHVLRRVSRDMLDGMNFAGWRVLIVGSERVDASVTGAFTRFLEPYGFSGRAVMPAYGLAEATLAVTGSRREDEVTEVCVDPASLVPGEQVRIGSGAVRPLKLVGCGRPLPGMTVSIVDSGGKPVGERFLGEIELTGKSVARGYLTAGERSEQPLNGMVRTGDAGFFLNGELFVAGRIGDGLKVRGRWLFAEDIDSILATGEPRRGRFVSLLGSIDGADTVVVLADESAVDVAVSLGPAVVNYASGLRVLVLSVGRGGILRTTSGKPRRRAMWERLVTGELETVTAWDSDPGPRP